MSYSGTFSLTDKGLDFRVVTKVHNQTVWVTVPFTWTTIAKMTDQNREMQVIIARVVSRVVASLEGDE